MIKLKFKPTIYLSGAVQRSKDPWTWRLALQNALKDRYDVIIPKDKIDVPANSTLADKQRVIKESIIMKDIHDVLGCAEFFVKIDPDVFKGAGTVSEITFAAYFNKHITYMLDDVKFQDIPNWVQGCLYNAMRVKNISDAIKYYKKLKL